MRSKAINMLNLNGGKTCDPVEEEDMCELPNCPCVLAEEWSEWSACNCGLLQQHRSKAVIREATPGGAACGPKVELRSCACPTTRTTTTTPFVLNLPCAPPTDPLEGVAQQLRKIAADVRQERDDRAEGGADQADPVDTEFLGKLTKGVRALETEVDDLRDGGGEPVEGGGGGGALIPCSTTTTTPAPPPPSTATTTTTTTHEDPALHAIVQELQAEDQRNREAIEVLKENVVTQGVHSRNMEAQVNHIVGALDGWSRNVSQHVDHVEEEAHAALGSARHAEETGGRVSNALHRLQSQAAATEVLRMDMEAAKSKAAELEGEIDTLQKEGIKISEARFASLENAMRTVLGGLSKMGAVGRGLRGQSGVELTPAEGQVTVASTPAANAGPGPAVTPSALPAVSLSTLLQSLERDMQNLTVAVEGKPGLAARELRELDTTLGKGMEELEGDQQRLAASMGSLEAQEEEVSPQKAAGTTSGSTSKPVVVSNEEEDEDDDEELLDKEDQGMENILPPPNVSSSVAKAASTSPHPPSKPSTPPGSKPVKKGSLISAASKTSRAASPERKAEDEDDEKVLDEEDAEMEASVMRMRRWKSVI